MAERDSITSQLLHSTGLKILVAIVLSVAATAFTLGQRSTTYVTADKLTAELHDPAEMARNAAADALACKTDLAELREDLVRYAARALASKPGLRDDAEHEAFKNFIEAKGIKGQTPHQAVEAALKGRIP